MKDLSGFIKYLKEVELECSFTLEIPMEQYHLLELENGLKNLTGQLLINGDNG